MTTITAERVESRIPKGWQLKNVKTLAAMSQETECFEASLYVDGKRVGTVGNAGHGGPNQYRWLDPAFGPKAEQVGREYDPQPYGGLDVMVGDMLLDADLAKAARKNNKAGFPLTVFIEADPYEAFPGHTSYAKSLIVGLRSELALPAELKRHNAARYRIVSEPGA